MGTEPKDFLEVARYLADTQGADACPAYFRSSISRAYYGLFHLCLEKLKEMGHTIGGKGPEK
ncbi:MAG: hypothetical protein V1918_02890, partial [Planctomycetota bacterium]